MPKTTSQKSEKELTTEKEINAEENEKTFHNLNNQNILRVVSAEQQTSLEAKPPTGSEEAKNDLKIQIVNHTDHVLYIIVISGFLAVIVVVLLSGFVIYLKLRWTSFVQRSIQVKAVPCENNYEMIRQDSARTGRLLD